MNKGNFVNQYCHSARIQFDKHRTLKLMLIPLLLVLALSVFPLKAYSCDATGDIPFRITNFFKKSNWCFECVGPWFRDSDSIFLDDENDLCTFYAANKTWFSPYGLWTCAVIQTDVPSAECSINDIDEETIIIHSSNLCLSSSDSAAEFDISSDGNFTSNLKPSPCSSLSLTPFLGDNPTQEKSKRDIDTFNFEGMAGDEVTISLEPDPQAGHNGGEATLILSGGSKNEVTTGALPLQIKSTLPATGECSIIVEQPRIPVDQRFRGSYILRLESSTGSIGLIHPTNNVEK